MIDCMLVGFNDYDFSDYVRQVAANGRDRGAFQDLRLSYLDVGGQPYRALDIMTELHEPTGSSASASRDFHNADFLWPVITYLGTFLHRRGFTWDYVNLFHRDKDRLARVLRTEQVRTVAITTTLYVSPTPIIEIVRFVREHSPATKIIVGGPYVANVAAVAGGPALEDALEHLGADIYVIGQEGELALTQVLAALRDNRPLDAVTNLVYRSAGQMVTTLRLPESNALAENMVDYSLFRAEDATEFVTTRTAKSCPFSCSFCGFPQRAGKYTYLDLAHVEKELDHIAESGRVNTVTFIDDTFNVPKVRFREILQLMIDKQYGFRWNSYYRSDHGDTRTIEMMSRAGCEGVFLGIESGSDAQLKRMNKTARRADYLTALRDFRRVGISTYASVIIGFPGETDETVAATESLLREGRPDFYRAQLWYCDPVTPIWERRGEFDIRGRGFNWSHRSMTAAQACAHIDRLFSTIEDPVWMPQFGFEQWSVFYLMRRGMTLDGVKDFVRAFNAAILDQLRRPDGRVSAELLERLRDTCQFEDAIVADVPAANREDHSGLASTTR